MPGDESKEQDYFYDSEEPQKPAARKAPSRPHESPANPVGLVKPRLKHATTPGQRAPSGATIAPPKPNPLPARGTGLVLFLNLTAAAIALIFAVLLAIKL